MKRTRNWLGIILILILAAGCTMQGNNDRKYQDIAPMKVANSGENSFTIINLTSDLTGTSDQDQAMGDAQSSPVFTAAWEAAQAMGAKDGAAFMRDIAPILEKWFINQPDNSQDNSQGGGTDPAPEPEPGPVPEPEPGPNPDPGDEVTFATFPCEGTMNYGDDEEYPQGIQVEQDVCLFTTWSNCSEIPEESFTIIWKDAAGNFEYLEVPNKCSMNMGNKTEGYRKFRPSHDKEPFKPVAYAPRYFDAVEVDLVKK